MTENEARGAEPANQDGETMAEIVAEMRKDKGFPVPYAPDWSRAVWTTDLVEYADRIEAAAKRERAKIEADALAVGGMVEALRKPTTEKSSAIGDAAAGTGQIPPAPDGKDKGLIGTRSTANAVISWNLADGLNVVVTARPVVKERIWTLECRNAGQARLLATIMGGRMTAQRMAKKIMGAMTGRAKKLRNNHARRVRQPELANQDGKEA